MMLAGVWLTGNQWQAELLLQGLWDTAGDCDEQEAHA